MLEDAAVTSSNSDYTGSQWCSALIDAAAAEAAEYVTVKRCIEANKSI